MMTTIIVLTVANALIFILWIFLWKWTDQLNKENVDLLKRVEELNKETKTILKLEK